MATWKQLVFSDDVPNLGNQDLSMSVADYTRDFVLIQTPFQTTKKTFRIMSETATTGNESPLLTIETPTFSQSGGSSAGGLFAVSTTEFRFDGLESLFRSNTSHSVTSPVVQFATTDVTILGGDDAAAAAPILSLHRNSPSPADGDELGQISFKGEDSGDNITAYATITGSIVDQTNATEDGALDMRLISDGVEKSALKLLPQPTEVELNGGTAASPWFHADKIVVYNHHTLRQLLLNEIGVTKSFETFFYETDNYGIQAGYEVWGLSAPVSTPNNNDFNNKSIRYDNSSTNITTTTVGQTFTHYSEQGALNAYNNQLDDLGGGSWITCHNLQSVTPYYDGKGMTYTFNGVFFYRQPDYTTNSTFTLDDETAGTIRIYQANTVGNAGTPSGGLVTAAASGDPDKIGYELTLMAKKDIVFEDGHDLTSVPFSLAFDSLEGGSPYEIFVVTFENTGTLTLGYDDAETTLSTNFNSIPFIKGEITRRIANELLA
jgi:hypothetical protein